MQRSFPFSSNFEGILDYFGWLIDKEDIDRNETTVKNGSSQRRKISVEVFDENVCCSKEIRSKRILEK